MLKDEADAQKVAAQHSKQYGLTVEFIYRYALRGYAARLSQASSRRWGATAQCSLSTTRIRGRPPEPPPSALGKGGAGAAPAGA